MRKDKLKIEIRWLFNDLCALSMFVDANTIGLSLSAYKHTHTLTHTQINHIIKSTAATFYDYYIFC